MDYNGLKELLKILSDKNNFLILVHDKPDGDAIGSATALALFLQKLQKKCAVLSPCAIPSRLAFVKNTNVKYYEGADSLDFSYSTCISIDVASPELLSDIPNKLCCKVDIAIDHHRVNTLEADFKYVDSNAASAGEIVFSLISAYNNETTNSNMFDPDICEALYTSISSDTGCFKYGNTTTESHKIASYLLNMNINAEEINRLLFDTKTFTQMKTEQLGIDNLQMFYDNKLAITCIDIHELEAIGASEEDTETISQLARMIAGVQIGALMREKKLSDGRLGYKFSVRANSDTDVSELCAIFGGGGHKKAAGCTIYENKETALEMFIRAAENYIK